ncbi:hypothetical protein EMCRGX_G003803 [Ephydatia muelleri]
MDATLLRMSQRPPPRFSAGTDLVLWLTRFELYVRLAKIPQDQVTGELLSLLDDGPFRVVSQQGLINSSYDSVVKCLRALYAPEGNELEWQRKLQDRMQKPGEQLVEFAGELRVLADRAYPRWSSEHRQEALRNQFMQGVRSSSIQLRLMKEMPPTLDDALKLASQLEAVEEAQKRLQKDRCKTESLALTDDTVADPDSCTSNATSGPGQQQYERESLEKRLSRQLRQAEADVQKLSTQVQQLLKESTMNTRRQPANSRDNTGQKRTDGPVCWGCGKKGHVKRDCPQRRTAFKNHLPSESAAVGDLSVRHNVLVADCLTQDCILGSDFLLLHGCVIDLHNHSLLVKGKVVPLSSGIYHSPISTCGVAVAETVEVPTHSQFRLIANRQGKKKEQGVDDLGSVMFEPSHDFMESHGLAVAHAVVGEDNEDIVVQILNPTPYSVQA